MERRMKGSRETEREMDLLGGFGSGQEEGPLLKFVSPSMGLDMIATHPDTMDVEYLFSFSSFLSHTKPISHRHPNEVKKH